MSVAVELSKQGRLTRVRKCGCGIWFYATDLKMRHCSDKCRKKAYEPSSEQIEHRQQINRNKQKRARRSTLREMIRAAAIAWESWDKPTHRYPRRSDRIMEQVNASLPRGRDPITGNWVTRHEKKIEAAVKRRNHAKA